MQSKQSSRTQNHTQSQTPSSSSLRFVRYTHTHTHTHIKEKTNSNSHKIVLRTFACQSVNYILPDDTIQFSSMTTSKNNYNGKSVAASSTRETRSMARKNTASDSASRTVISRSNINNSSKNKRKPQPLACRSNKKVSTSNTKAGNKTEIEPVSRRTRSNGIISEVSSDNKENNNRAIVPSLQNNRRKVPPDNCVIVKATSKKKTPLLQPVTPISYRTRGKLAILNRPLLPIDPVVKSYFRHYYNEDVSTILSSNDVLLKSILSGNEVALGLLKLYWIENCRKGFDKLLNRKDKKGCGALHYASVKVGIDTTPCMHFVMAHKVDVNIKNFVGVTPAMLASGSGNSYCLDYLIKNNADVNLGDNNGCTPLMVAKNETVATILLKAGASVNTKSKRGIPALLCALFDRNVPVIHRLIDFEADINAWKKKYNVGRL